MTPGQVFIFGRGGDDLICVEGALPKDISPYDDQSEIDGGPGTDYFQYGGSSGKDVFEVFDVENLDIHARGGIDRARLWGTIDGTGTIDGGGRRNNLMVVPRLGAVHADLEDELLAVGTQGSFDLKGFDKVRASAWSVVLLGDAADNLLTAYACQAKLSGGKGDDVVRARAFKRRHCEPLEAMGAKITGQRGNDRVRGTSRNNILLGGPGRDSVIGKGGKDGDREAVRGLSETASASSLAVP